MEPITDREIMIRLDGNVTQLKDSIERFAKALEELETTKFKDHESRIAKLERFQHELGGVYKFIGIISLILGIIAVVIGIKK